MPGSSPDDGKPSHRPSHVPEPGDALCVPGEHPPAAPALPTLAYEEASRLFRTLGDVERLRLLEVLARGELCVSELASSLEAPVPAVSQRLRVLRAEALVARRRAGKHVYYSLADQHVLDLLQAALAHTREPRAARPAALLEGEGAP
jgi:ArsR family transcriptional regulator, lead/cadmium/zinc/bismuth-responsive transcriptional repressor